MKALIILFLFILNSVALAHSVQRSIPPQYQFPVSNNASGITEIDVWTLLSILHTEFGSGLGDSSWMSGFKWEAPHLGAGSKKTDNQFSILLYGGMVRARYSTIGSVSAVICHELGHALGGPPYQIFPNENPHWSSAEGQSDSFAANTCLPRLYDRLLVQAPRLIQPSEEPSTQSLCARSNDPKKCEWVATSGIDFIQMVQVYFDLDTPQADPNLWTREQVSKTLHTQYPSYQCRMDIYKSKAADPDAKRLPCWFSETP